jgi:predicted O-linked N-acetylglucosamine transferase (SPINDLY family)
MGYSLLSTAGITEGIAHSWEEYIEWAVRLATDHDLRLSIKERLAKGKDPDNLCPLWNPKQFARDMYNILQELYEQAEV